MSIGKSKGIQQDANEVHRINNGVMEKEMTNPAPLQMVVLPKAEWEIVKESLRKVESLITANVEEAAKSIFVESEAARKELGICPRAWQMYRDNRTIPFSQFGRKIWVKRADINNFIESHRIS